MTNLASHKLQSASTGTHDPVRSPRTRVRNFTDYRAFLIAHAQDKKARNPRWSYGSWAKSLGLKSTSSLTKILSGDRQPGPDLTDRLIRYFEFSPKEADYLKDLVRLNRVHRDPRLSVALLEKMSKEHPQSALRVLDDQTFSLLSQWHIFAVREMTRLDRFVEDPQWMSREFKFRVGPRDCARAIQILLQTGLLTRDQDNRLILAEGRIDTQSDQASEAIKRYHEQMLENAKQSIRTIPVDRREITASTLVVRAQNMAQAKEKIREFKRNFCRTFEEPSGDGVYQIQIQFFPLTEEQSK
jgi:uncharacterized protein (TIGR02147 family)